MIQSEPLDFSALIRRLAEMERECPDCSGEGVYYWAMVPENVDLRSCSHCNGTGRIVPFAALRRVCVADTPEWHFGPITQEGFSFHEAEGCPGWVPEPDPLRAFALAETEGPWVEVHCWKGGTRLWFFTVRDAAGCAGHGNDPIADYAFWWAVQKWEKGEAADAQR